MTIEADDRPDYWLQILPEASEHDGQLEGFVLNFPYRGHTGDPVETLRQRGLTPPPGTETREWEDNAFAMIWIRPDVPLVGLAHFAGDILQVIVGAARSAEQIGRASCREGVKLSVGRRGRERIYSDTA